MPTPGASLMTSPSDLMNQRLTKLEKEMLQRAAAFVLAGEWPWEDDNTAQEARERAALESALQKLTKQ